MSLATFDPIQKLDTNFFRKRNRNISKRIFSKIISLSPSLISSIVTSLDIMFIYIFYRSSGKWDDMTDKTNVDFPRLQVATADDPQKALHIAFVVIFSLIFFLQYPVRMLMLRHHRLKSYRQRSSRCWGMMYTFSGLLHLIFTLTTIFGLVASTFSSGDVNEDFTLDKETLTIVFYSFFHTGFTSYVFVWVLEDILILSGHPEQINIFSFQMYDLFCINTLMMITFRFFMFIMLIVSEIFWIVMISIGDLRTSKFLGCNSDTFYGINQLVFLVVLVVFLATVAGNTAILAICDILKYHCDKSDEYSIMLLEEVKLESNKNFFNNRKQQKNGRRKKRGKGKKNSRLKLLRRRNDIITGPVINISKEDCELVYNEDDENINNIDIITLSEYEFSEMEEGIIPHGVYSTPENSSNSNSHSNSSYHDDGNLNNNKNKKKKEKYNNNDDDYDDDESISGEEDSNHEEIYEVKSEENDDSNDNNDNNNNIQEIMEKNNNENNDDDDVDVESIIHEIGDENANDDDIIIMNHFD